MSFFGDSGRDRAKSISKAVKEALSARASLEKKSISREESDLIVSSALMEIKKALEPVISELEEVDAKLTHKRWKGSASFCSLNASDLKDDWDDVTCSQCLALRK